MSRHFAAIQNAKPAVGFAQTDPKDFVAATYRHLFVALAGMTVLGLLSYFLLPQESLVPLAIADAVIWVACGWFCWRRPVGFVFPLFTVVTGLLVGQLAHLHHDVFAAAAVLTVVGFGGLSLFVHVTRTDFSFLAGFLWVAFFVLVGGILLFPFFAGSVYVLGLSAFGVLTFAGWILYDTSRIVFRADPELTPAIAAFELFMDIIGLFRWLLDLLWSFNLSGSDFGFDSGIDLDLDL